jgi:hypothetical protein
MINMPSLVHIQYAYLICSQDAAFFQFVYSLRYYFPIMTWIVDLRF